MIGTINIPTTIKRTTLTNLVRDCSFEDALNYWNCWLAEPTDTSQAKTGTQSLKLGGDALAATKNSIPLIAGHKYYGREYIKTAGELTASDCRFELCGDVNGVEKAFVFGWNRGNYPDWTAISNIVTADGSYDTGFGVRTFTVGGSVDAWVDSIVVIDLTAACGVGNEPSKEWCDANIPYFEESYLMDIPIDLPIQKTMEFLDIPEGVVVEIARDGDVVWATSSDTVVLEVEKKIGDTYAGDTSYSGEEFILLDIYPKTNGTVLVSYGGLTKTIIDTSGAESPNAQQVFFGTFNGVSDRVPTPTSGTLTIEGDYESFACGSYQAGKIALGKSYWHGVTKVIDLGHMKAIESNTFGVNASLSFSGCGRLVSAKISTRISYIGTNAFANCVNLTSITIPNSVMSIGLNAFYGCTMLTSVTLSNRLRNISDGLFHSCVNLTSITIPNRVTTIELNAFANCVNLTSITIPNSVTNIPYNPFCGCLNLKEFVIHGNKFISENGALFDELKTKIISYPSVNGSYSIPNGVMLINNCAFHSCVNLTSITIPDSVTIIGTSAFYGCTMLTSVTIPDSVTGIGDYAFYNNSSLTSITIPNSVTSIGSNAFYACRNLTSITIPNGVTRISAYIFSNCSALTSVNIPEGVTSIENYAFIHCYNLLNITIPSSVTSIATGAFNYNHDDNPNFFRTIIMLSTIPPTLIANGNNNNFTDIFGGMNYGLYKIIVPKGCLNAYKQADVWSGIPDGVIVEAS